MVRVSVLGLGYVGAVSAACLAADGHQVIGVDPDVKKVDLINQGRAPIVEPGLSELVEREVASGRLRATGDHRRALLQSEIAVVCVGTPSRSNGDLDSSHLSAVARQIGSSLDERDDYFVVSVRSTSFPGTTERVVMAELASSTSKQLGTDYGVCFNPEFLREGSALMDYYNPARLVVGGLDERSIDRVVGLYDKVETPVVRTDIAHAEMVKYIDNAWHALKVGFANEVGRLAKTLELDGRDLMDIFVLDTKLNISGKYLRPGFAFGGSCLPKDLRALTHQAERLDVDVPIMRSILASNRVHIDWAIEMIRATGAKSIGVLGLSFKPETDDLRESPMVTVVERLIGKGHTVQIFDPVIRLGSLRGANRAYLLEQIPHISTLIVDDVDEVLDSDALVIGTAHESFKDALASARPGRPVVDLVGMLTEDREDYVGIGW
jgi:GDP-mannose 6-dehydrogenase